MSPLVCLVHALVYFFHQISIMIYPHRDLLSNRALVRETSDLAESKTHRINDSQCAVNVTFMLTVDVMSSWESLKLCVRNENATGTRPVTCLVLFYLAHPFVE